MAAAVIGAATVTYVFYPGYISFDSIWELQQGRAGVYDDTHPPITAFVWGLLDRLWAGPQLMLVLQNIVFWGGLAAFSLWLSRRWAWAIVLAVGFWPPVFGQLGTVWKDIGMGAAFLASLASIVFLGSTPRRYRAPVAALSFTFLCYATLARQNAILPVLPLVALLANGLLPFERAKWKRTLGAAGVLLITLLGIYLLVDRLLVSHRTYLWQQSMAFDLVGISLAEKHDQFPDSYWRVEPKVSLDQMRELYDPSHSGWLFFTPKPGRHFEFIQTGIEPMPKELQDLAWAWAVTVASHPLDFVVHRARMGRVLFGLGTPEVCLAFQEGVDANDLGVPTSHSPINKAIMRFLHFVRNGVLFRGWIYVLILLLGLAAVALRPGPRRPVIAALALSGLLNALPHLVIGVGCDFRFLFWTVVSALLVTWCFLIQAITVWRAQRAVAEPVASAG